ncbi:MAG: BadF/BadG/BcrA/BcrD ATPase family protein [Candidatus Dormiibacterota bacterium]
MESKTAGPAVLAVDGGNSKTDVALVGRDGSLLGRVRVARSSHLGLGYDTSAEGLTEAVRQTYAMAGLEPTWEQVAEIGVFCVAGVDLPVDERRIDRLLRAKGWTRRLLLRNDTFAMLRAGSDRGWGVAVGCGSGLNCAGVSPAGKAIRYPALGYISGDLAEGGAWLGQSALAAALRARDGRGDRTELEQLVPQHFALHSPSAVLNQYYVGRINDARLSELAPVVFVAAVQGDQVARQILDRLADEIVAMAGAVMRRLHLTRRDMEVVLGGGVFRSWEPLFVGRIREGVTRVNSKAALVHLTDPPVLGAALIGLDSLGAGATEAARLRRELGGELPQEASSNGAGLLRRPTSDLKDGGAVRPMAADLTA